MCPLLLLLLLSDTSQTADPAVLRAVSEDNGGQVKFKSTEIF